MTTQTKTTWRKVKLGDFAKINPSIKLQHGKAYPFLDMADVQPLSRTTNWQKTKVFSVSGARFEDKDTLFARITPCLENGKITQALNLENGGFGSTEFYVLRGKDKVSDSDFVHYLSRTYKIRKLAEGSMIGASGRQRVERAAFENIEVEVPEDVNTQKRIAEVLSALDNKIELNNKISRTLEQMAQAIFKEWFVNFRFPGHEKVKMIDSELGKIPEGWAAKSWGDLEGVSIAGDWGQDNKSNEAPRKAYILRGTDIPALQAGTKEECPARYLTQDSLKRRQLRPGDIVIEISGGSKDQPTGRSILITQGILNRFELPLICTSFCRLVRGNGILAPILMYLHIDRLYRTKKIWNYQLQSTGISNFQYGQFKKYERLFIPKIEIQNQIADTLYSHIEYGHRNENQKLAALRDLLLPKLMSGAIRV